MVAVRLRTRASAVVVVLVTVLAMIMLLAPHARAAAPTACTHHPVLCPEHLYLGVAIEGLPEDPAAVAPFEAATGASPTVSLTFTAFNRQMNAAALRGVSDAGMLPMVTWEPWSWGGASDDSFSLQSIIAGEFDDYIRAQGAALAEVGAPVVLRFAHEMNGHWYPWGNGVNGNTPADYINAYRHVHDVVRAAGGTNVVWMWSPNTLDATKGVHLAPFYPGDAYVDWVGLSSYFSLPTNTFVGVAKRTIIELDELAPTKPIYIAETSVLSVPDRPAMIRELMTGLLSIPRLVGLTWFNYHTKNDYRIQNDPPAARELSAHITGPHFGTAGHVDDPLIAAPMAKVRAAVTGTAHVGQTLTGAPGTWRTSPSSGPVSSTSRWYRCSDAASTSSCVPVTPAASGVPPRYTLTAADARSYLRVGETSRNKVGSTLAWSAPTLMVIMPPATPAAPTVEARDGGLRVTFPSAPTGTTHWRLTLNGVAKPAIPVGTREYWLNGLTNGTGYKLSLAAVSQSSASRGYVSAATSGVGVPMRAPWTPWFQVKGGTATFSMPSQSLPANATWVLTVDGRTTVIPRTTRTHLVTGLTPGVHSWSLRAAAGSWGNQTNVVRTPAVTGQLTVR